MYKFEKEDILSKDQIQVGIRYIFSGEIRYGIELADLSSLKDFIETLDKTSKTELIVFDITKLKRWDSLGIKVIVPKILEINSDLKSKGRLLISVIGDKESDLYAAAKDKYPEISDINFPWYSNLEEYLKHL